MQKSEVSKKDKEQIVKLADQDFVTRILNKRLAEYYPDFSKIKKIKLTPYKHHIGKTGVVFVVGYEIDYLST